MGRKQYEDASGWNEMSKDLKAMKQPAKNPKEAERRKNRRPRLKDMDTMCFGCRERGHSVSNCPKADGGGICYKCGMTNHITVVCTKKMKPGEQEFPFATCYICKEKGHISKACPENPRGLYINGGCCKQCG